MSETISVGDLALGKQVTGSDGKKVGVINEVIENPAASADTRASFYFVVNRGGLLGIGASHLYIPVDPVADAQQGGEVVLTCTSEEANQKYGRQTGKDDSE